MPPMQCLRMVYDRQLRKSPSMELYHTKKHAAAACYNSMIVDYKSSLGSVDTGRVYKPPSRLFPVSELDYRRDFTILSYSNILGRILNEETQ